MSVGIVKVVTLVVNHNTTEEHYSDGNLAGWNRCLFMWILTRQMPVSWTGGDVERENKSEEELIIPERLLSAQYFQIELHAVEEWRKLRHQKVRQSGRGHTWRRQCSSIHTPSPWLTSGTILCLHFRELSSPTRILLKWVIKIGKH